MAAATRKRAILLRCGLVIVGLVFALGLAEIILWLLGVSYPRPYIADEHVGTRLQPGLAGWFTKEGATFATMNQAGFRDREHAVTKPDNTFRILVLGDSYVEALQLPQEQTFWSVLEQQLAPCIRERGQQVEVIAMGVSGWGTAQQLQALQHYGFKYEPDRVVLAFFAANDLQNNVRELEGDPARPYFVLENDDLKLDDSFRQDSRFLKASSAMTRWKVALINRFRMLQLIQEIRERPPEADTNDPVLAEAGLSSKCFRAPEDEAWTRAWKVTEHLIEEMHGQCKRRATQFTVMTINSPIQVHPDSEVRATFCRHIGVSDLDYADRRIAELGSRSGFQVVTLAGPLLDYAAKNNVYLHGFANTRWGEGHWNATGHRIVGEMLADHIVAALVKHSSSSNE